MTQRKMSLLAKIRKLEKENTELRQENKKLVEGLVRFQMAATQRGFAKIERGMFLWRK